MLLHVRQKDGDIDVSGNIVYFNSQQLNLEDRRKLCKQIKAIKYLKSEEGLSEENRKYADFAYRSYGKRTFLN